MLPPLEPWMHEASAAEAVVRMACAAAAEHSVAGKIPRVIRIRLVVGESMGYMEESLAFYVRSLGKDSVVEGAVVETRFEKATFRCGSCGTLYERKRFSFACPSCGGEGSLVSTGSKLYIDSIELEE
jgi:hydrogenase nickel incorporation protein HypA/HybF